MDKFIKSQGFKKSLIAVVTVLAVFYTLFLLILPNIINLNNYKKDIQKLVNVNTGLNIDASDIKIITTPKLHAGLRVKGLKITYPDGKEIVNADESGIKIKLLPLLFHTIELESISVDSPKITVRVKKDGNLDIADYITQNISEGNADPIHVQVPLKFSDKLPKIILKNYQAVVTDETTDNNVIVKGETFVLDKTTLNKQLRVATNGKILSNKNSNIIYDIKIDSFLPVIEPAKRAKEPQPKMNTDFVNEFVKFDLKGNLKADLKIREDKEGLNIDGYLNADKLSAKLDSQNLPESFAHLVFNGHKINADADFYFSEIEKASIKANIANGKKTNIDLDVVTDKISLASIQKFAASLLNSFDVKNDLNSLVATGYIQSDFCLKTDLKKLKSKGFFKVVNGSVSHKSLPVSIKSIGADIDFSKNSLDIKKAGAVINGAAFEMKGKIDSHSNADILVVSDPIPLNILFTVFAPADIKKAFTLQSGIAKLDASIKGKLENIKPEVDIKLTDLKIKDKISGIIFTNSSSVVNLNAQTDKKNDFFNGKITVLGTKILMLNPRFEVNIPAVKININPKDLITVPFNINLETSVINVDGSIKDYAKNPDIKFKVHGKINTSDLKKLMPNEVRSAVVSKGAVPLNVLVLGDDKNLAIKAQISSDPQNYFSILTVKKMLGKTGLINLSLTLKNDVMKINDIGLYNMNKPYSSDIRRNINGAQEIITVKGAINEISSKSPVIKKAEIVITTPLMVSTPIIPQSTLKLRGHINANGKLNNPSIRGFFEVKEINLPEFLSKIDLINVNFNDSILNADIQNLNINGSPINIKADALTKFNKIFVINNMEVYSTGLDADKMFLAMNASIPAANSTAIQTTSKNAVIFPIKIIKGHATIDKFKMGEIIATKTSSDFTMQKDVVYLNGLKAQAFGGTLGGDVSYNLATTAMKADVYGKAMNANAAVSAATGLKEQVQGTLGFDANVSLRGADYKQQMKTLNGNAKFSVNDGQLGSLGRFETFIQAGNLLSEKFVRSQMGIIVNAIAPFNTGKIAYLNGDLTFKNGSAMLHPVKSSGPYMSLLITGNMNLINNNASLQILGALSPEIMKALGPIGDLSIDKIASFIPMFGSTIADALNTYNTQADESLLSQIPSLTPEKENTRAFKVVINGNLNTPPKTIKSFRWLNTAKAMEETQESLLKLLTPQITVDGTKVTIPTNKEELRAELENQIQNKLDANEKVQELKENETVKNLGAIYNFYKGKSK